MLPFRCLPGNNMIRVRVRIGSKLLKNHLYCFQNGSQGAAAAKRVKPAIFKNPGQFSVFCHAGLRSAGPFLNP